MDILKIMLANLILIIIIIVMEKISLYLLVNYINAFLISSKFLRIT